jgi:hypothetical protein
MSPGDVFQRENIFALCFEGLPAGGCLIGPQRLPDYPSQSGAALFPFNDSLADAGGHPAMVAFLPANAI